MEKIRANNEFMESKKNSMSKSFHAINLAWKDFEEHLDSSEKTFQEAILDLQVREDDLNSKCKSVAESKEELELTRNAVKFGLEELVRKEEDFGFYQRERMEYLMRREEQMEARFSYVKRYVEERRIGVTDLKEDGIGSMLTRCSRSRELDDVESSCVLDLKTMQIQIDKELGDLDVKKREEEERWKELLHREKLVEDLEIKCRRRNEDLNVKERLLNDCSKSLDLIQKLNEESRMIIELKGGKEEQVQELLPTRTPWNSLPHGTVPDLFRLSSDPARFLLDGMQCCFLSILKDDTNVNGGPNNTMEVFLPLLKELVKLTDEIVIHSNIHTEALSFAVDWKEKLQFSKGQQALCFLLFLSIYKLGSWFNHEELFHLLCESKNDNISGYLLRDFVLEQKMVDYIQKLVAEQQQQLEAITYIYNFDLVNKFPPVPLLKEYLLSATTAAREIYSRDKTAEARAESIEKELIVVQKVVNCIVDRDLESFYPLEPLKKRINELLRRKNGGNNPANRVPPPYNLRSRPENQAQHKKRPAPISDSELEPGRVKKLCSHNS